MHVESLGLACSAIDSVQYDVNEGLHRNPGGKQICMYVMQWYSRSISINMEQELSKQCYNK